MTIDRIFYVAYAFMRLLNMASIAVIWLLTISGIFALAGATWAYSLLDYFFVGAPNAYAAIAMVPTLYGVKYILWRRVRTAC